MRTVLKRLVEQSRQLDESAPRWTPAKRSVDAASAGDRATQIEWIAMIEVTGVLDEDESVDSPMALEIDITKVSDDLDGIDFTRYFDGEKVSCIIRGKKLILLSYNRP